MNPFTMIPKTVRAWLYAAGLAGALLLEALDAGFGSINVADPRWLVFLTAFWLKVVGPAGLALAVSNVSSPATVARDRRQLEASINVSRKKRGKPPLDDDPTPEP